MVSKHILSVLVLNCALVCVGSMFYEHKAMKDKIESLNSTVSLSVDTALQNSLVSEELWGSSSSWDADVTSKNEAKGKLTYYDGSKWNSGDMHSVVMDFDYNSGSVNSRFPSSPSEVDSDDVYNWLYNSSEFDNFYGSIGSKLTTDLYTKRKTNTEYSSDTYELGKSTVPILDQMGVYSGTVLSRTSDSFTDTGKLGKQEMSGAYTLPETEDNEVITDGMSKYYLTPTSLGVTYLDPRVVLPTVISNLENTMRCKRGSDTECLGVVKQPIKFMGRTVETKSPSDSTFNNGLFAIDMDSVSVDIDYATVDAYASASSPLMSYLEGAERNKASALSSEDTANQYSKTDSRARLVAKVTVNMDVYIPYSTGIMQYIRYLGRTGDDDYCVIRSLDSSGETDTSSDCLKYTYVTYVSVGR